jgi:hypothetical protein
MFVLSLQTPFTILFLVFYGPFSIAFHIICQVKGICVEVPHLDFSGRGKGFGPTFVSRSIEGRHDHEFLLCFFIHSLGGEHVRRVNAIGRFLKEQACSIKKIANSQISGRKPKQTQPYHFVCTIDDVLQPQIASGAGSVEQKTIL